MKTENKTTLQKAFELFYGNEADRPVMQAPFVVGDYTYATDAYTLIRCKTELIDFEFTNEHKALSVEFVVNPQNTNEPIAINSFDWDSAMTADEMEETGEDIECGHCNGEGTCEDSFYYNKKMYHFEYECPVCEGSGFESETKQVPTGRKTFASTALVKLKDSKFYASKFYRLKQVADLLKMPVVLISYIANNKASLFQVGNVEVIIMPCMSYNDEDVIFNFLQ